MSAGAKLAIADPPYPPHRAVRRDRPGSPDRLLVRSRARRWYGDGTRAMNDRAADHHERAGDWDRAATHWELVERLMDEYDGWAIATTMDGVDYYRPLPVPTTTLIWHKPNGHSGEGRVRATIEAVIVRIPDGRRGRRETSTRSSRSCAPASGADSPARSPRSGPAGCSTRSATTLRRTPSMTCSRGRAPCPPCSHSRP